MGGREGLIWAIRVLLAWMVGLTPRPSQKRACPPAVHIFRESGSFNAILTN
jgi:hypothetical protein